MSVRGIDTLLRGRARVNAALTAVLRLRIGHIRLSFQYTGFGFIALGGILHLRERQLRLRTVQLRNRQPKLGLGLIALGGGITRIDHHQHIPFLHALVIPHAKFGDVACRFGAMVTTSPSVKASSVVSSLRVKTTRPAPQSPSR